MSVAQDRPIPDMLAMQDRTARVRTVAILTIVLVSAVLWQTRWGTIPDTSWIISICERMLGGDRLYIDLIETNPPFTSWILMPVVATAVALGLPPETLVSAYCYAVCLVGLGFASLIARRAGFAENRMLWALLPAFLAVLLIFPGNAFSEREHLGVALLLPFLALVAWRANPAGMRTPSLPLVVFAGLCGSVLVLVKPYYALVLLAPALYAAWNRRSIWMLVTLEYWIVAAVCVSYLLTVLYFYPQFFNTVYPVVEDTYMRIHNIWPLLLKYGGCYLAALYTLRFLRPGLSLSPLVAVFAVASLAATVPLVYQGKGWPYHAFPALSLIVAALLLRAAQIGASTSGMTMDRARKVLLLLVILANAVPFLPTQKPDAAFVNAIRAQVQRPSVALIGSDIAVGHPLTRMIEGKWISAYCSDWLGSFAVYLSKIAEQSGDPVAAAHYSAIADTYVSAKRVEFENAKPTLVLVERDDPVWTGWLLDHPEFSRLMSNYRQIAKDANVLVFARKDARQPPSSPAAASD